MLTFHAIAAHPDLYAQARAMASSYLEIAGAAPRHGSVFASTQRYLLCQVLLAMAFESRDGTFLTTRFKDEIEALGIASRNTADAFVTQALRSGLIVRVETPNLRRARPIRPSSETEALLLQWLLIALTALDGLDGGDRAGRLAADPALVRRLHPVVVRLILASELTVQPAGTIALFSWMTDGSLIMDRIVVSLGDVLPEGDRLETGIASLAELMAHVRIARSHLVRQIAAAASLGGVGWTGKKGASRLWISRDFLDQYLAYQADKIARVDHAFHAVFGEAEEARAASPGRRSTALVSERAQ